MTATKAKPAIDITPALRPITEADQGAPILAWMPHARRYAVMYWVPSMRAWLEQAGDAERPHGCVNIDLSQAPR